MDTSKEEVQRNKFRDILFELASNQELLKDKSVRAKMYSRLEVLYWPEESEKPFRHFYSDIFSVLTAVYVNYMTMSVWTLPELHIRKKETEKPRVKRQFWTCSLELM